MLGLGSLGCLGFKRPPKTGFTIHDGAIWTRVGPESGMKSPNECAYHIMFRIQRNTQDEPIVYRSAMHIPKEWSRHKKYQVVRNHCASAARKVGYCVAEDDGLNFEHVWESMAEGRRSRCTQRGCDIYG